MIECVLCHRTTSLSEREAIGLGWWTVSRESWGNGPPLRDKDGDLLWRCSRHADPDLTVFRDSAYFVREAGQWRTSTSVGTEA